MTDQPIEIIHTPCKNCVFAIYDSKTQTGCHLNYLDKYRDKNTEILEVYDNDLEFFIINGKKCIGYRENKWFAQYGLEHSSIEDKIAKIKELNKVDYVLIINFLEIGDSWEDLENLKTTLSSLTIHPGKIIFIRRPEGETTIYAEIQKIMTQSKINCKWRIQTMVDESMSNQDILHNAINNDKSYRFICHLKKAISNSLNHVVVTANNIVYQELDKFMVLTDQDNTCVFFSAGVYRFSLAETGVDLLSDNNSFQIV
jgi:hypothetical protein